MVVGTALMEGVEGERGGGGNHGGVTFSWVRVAVEGGMELADL